MSDHKWLAQLRKGYLEICVLVMLQQQKSSYGFAMLQQFIDIGIEVNEGTLYPLLNRMHKNGWLDSYWETPVDGGHPRRFYSLTEAGGSLLPMMVDTYRQQQASLDKLMETL